MKLEKDYIVKNKDELVMTGKQLRDFKEIVIQETLENIDNKEKHKTKQKMYEYYTFLKFLGYFALTMLAFQVNKINLIPQAYLNKIFWLGGIGICMYIGIMLEK